MSSMTKETLELSDKLLTELDQLLRVVIMTRKGKDLTESIAHMEFVRSRMELRLSLSGPDAEISRQIEKIDAIIQTARNAREKLA